MNKKNQNVTKKRSNRKKQRNNKTNKRKNVKGGFDYINTNKYYDPIYDYDPIDEEIDDFYKNLNKRDFSKIEKHEWDTLDEDLDNEGDINYYKENMKRLKDEKKKTEKENETLNKEIKNLKNDKADSRIVGNLRSIERLENKIVKNNKLLYHIKKEMYLLRVFLNNIKERQLTQI